MTELYPEIAAPGVKDDDQPSCSAAEALTRQEPFINQNLAYQALGMLTQLLRHGSVSYQGGFCNLLTGQLVPLGIRGVAATVRQAAGADRTFRAAPTNSSNLSPSRHSLQLPA